jgi:hypothetical protein
MLRKLTINLVPTYKVVNKKFQYISISKTEFLTVPNESVGNSWDNVNGDLILKRGDLVGLILNN